MEVPRNTFWQGFYAFNDGSCLEACPFSHNSIDARFWYGGFALAHSLVHGRGRKGLRLNEDAGERTSSWTLGWDT
jgi:hypothetical protein